jgi:long-chain acyl-CoA synthetase
MCHQSGFLQSLVALHAGITLLVVPRFEPERVLQLFSDHQVAASFAHPAMLLALLNHPGASAHDLHSLQHLIAGGDTVTPELHRRCQERFSVTPMQLYGLTESLIALTNPAVEGRKVGSIGLPGPGLMIRLIDSEGGDVPQGEVGEILLKSQAVMAGYWQAPEATAEVLQDGWLHTGDLARCDEDGYYWFMGRKKEIIIRGGSNISPPEVEGVLCQHPAVHEAGVVGVPDAAWGEVVHAFVALKEGAAASEAELQQFVAERLAAYKVPEVIRFLPELPKGAMGKVHRQVLREWATAPEKQEAIQ